MPKGMEINHNQYLQNITNPNQETIIYATGAALLTLQRPAVRKFCKELDMQVLILQEPEDELRPKSLASRNGVDLAPTTAQADVHEALKSLGIGWDDEDAYNHTDRLERRQKDGHERSRTPHVEDNPQRHRRARVRQRLRP